MCILAYIPLFVMSKKIITFDTNIPELKKKIDQLVILMKEIEDFQIKLNITK